MMTSSGIYTITNTRNGKCYVGSAVSFRRRWYEHRSLLRRGTHHSRHLQRAWDKHGEKAFTFAPLLVCAPKDLIFYEQRAIDTMLPAYNGSPTAGNCLGIRRTPETRARMSAANKGKSISPEHLEAMLAARRGVENTPEHNDKIRAKAIGRGHSAETRAKIAEKRASQIITEEHRAAISAGNKGKPKPPRTAEHSAKIAAANAGVGLGTKKSPETIAKMCIAAQARVKRQKDFIAVVVASAKFWEARV